MGFEPQASRVRGGDHAHWARRTIANALRAFVGKEKGGGEKKGHTDRQTDTRFGQKQPYKESSKSEGGGNGIPIIDVKTI